jgi:3-oxoacyl-[acyl-carrier protein] reductase
MRDLLLELGAHPAARRLVARLGIPVPLPVRLQRGRGPWEARPLADWTVVVGAGGPTLLGPAVAKTIARAGGLAAVASGDAEPFREAGHAYGRPATTVRPEALPQGFRSDALLFDASGLDGPTELRAAYEFFHPLLATLRSCGRVLILARPAADAATAPEAATRGALEGFARSLAKEIGRRGSTANLVLMAPGAEAHIEPVLRFFLSNRAAFVTGQPVVVGARLPAVADAPLVRPLEQRVALVTGAARGIGEAIARRLAEEGAHVICLDRPADDTAGGQVARSVGGSFLAVDIGDPGAAAVIAAHVRQRHGGVDIVVHNAGVTRDKTLARMSAAAWDDTLNVNLRAPLRIDQALLDGDLLREGGRLVCLASVAGIAGNPGQTNYAASKAGLAAYVRRRAGELAPRRIAVSAVAPGLIETRMSAAMPALVREAARRLSALGQGGLAADVAEVVTLLSTPGAAGLTGTVLRVCGGALIGA